MFIEPLKPCTEIALAMRTARLNLGWTQEDLSKKVKEETNIPLSVSTIKQYEQGTRPPSRKTIVLVSRVFERRPDSKFSLLIGAIQENGHENGQVKGHFLPPAPVWLYNIGPENHIIETSKECTLVRWQGTPSLRGIRDTRKKMTNHINQQNFRAFIADMTNSGIPDSRAQRWSIDWLHAHQIAAMIFFGANFQTRMTIMSMIDVFLSFGWTVPTMMFCLTEAEARRYLRQFQQTPKIQG